MRLGLLIFLASFTISNSFLRADAPAAPATDPRPGLVAFFDAIRQGDEAAALDCWFADISDSQQRDRAVELVGYLIREMVASYRFEQAMAERFPDAYARMKEDGRTTPDAEMLAAAQFTVYRRLAIVRWGNNEDDGFPMVLDNSDRANHVWKISLQQWRQTTRSSVGDSMLMSGWGRHAKEQVTKEIRDGQLQTIEEVQDAFLRHLSDIANIDEKPEEPEGSAR